MRKKKKNYRQRVKGLGIKFWRERKLEETGGGGSNAVIENNDGTFFLNTRIRAFLHSSFCLLPINNIGIIVSGERSKKIKRGM